MLPEAPVNGMWDPLLLWQVPVYSRYLLRPPSSAFWAALTIQPQNTAFLQARGLWVGSLAPVPPLCSALSEQLQVEPCLSQTVEKCHPIASLSNSCASELLWPQGPWQWWLCGRIVPSLLNLLSLFLQTD